MKKAMMAALIFLSTTATLFAGGNSEKAAGTASQSTEQSKILRIMNLDVLDSLDTQIATSGTAFEVIANTTDGLMQMKADGSVEKALCASEEVSADGLVRTYKIREDANWSNGDPVTAADFVYGWHRAVDPAIASEYSWMLSDIGQVKNAAAIIEGKMPVEDLGVKALDAKTLQVTLAAPVSFFDELMYFPTYYPVNQKFCESKGDTYATSADTLLSNGAFVMTDYEPAATTFKMVKNQSYYDADRIKIDGINYQVLLDSQQALMSYQNDDLDMIILSGDQIDQVKDDPDYLTYGAGYLWYLQPNIQDNPVLANLNFRKALTFALNRDSIVENVTKDGSVPCYAMCPSELSFNEEGEDFTSDPKTFEDDCAFDLAKATMYYNKAKAELGMDTFDIEMIVDDLSIQQNVAAVIKSQLEKALPGLTLELRVEPKKQRVQDGYDRNFDVTLTRWGPDYADPTTYLGMFVTGNSNNWGEWSNADYDKLIYDCMAGDLINKPAERWQALKEAEAIGMADAVIMPLYQQSNAVMVNPKVKGLAFHPVALNRVYKDVYFE